MAKGAEGAVTAEAGLVKLRAQMAAMEEAAEAAGRAAAEGAAAVAAVAEDKLGEQLVSLRTELDAAVAASAASRQEAEAQAKAAAEQAALLQSEVSGLKAGLGLAGLGGEPLAKAAQLEQLEQRVTLQLDKAADELRAAQARLEGAKERVETDAAVRAELAGKAAADAAAAERKAAADKEAAAAAQRIEEEAAQRAEAAAGS